jgi:anion-transporting  ArsA/GET3 family ATPase
LAIDPARALGRALGLDTLAPDGETIPIDAPGTFSAAMLEQKHAWDRFVARHAPTPASAQTLLANPFYQRLSTAFAGSTEYMAIEEMCRLADSGAYDLVVLDTPPATHAIDFLRGPDRIDRLLDAPRSFSGGAARFVARQLERAAGGKTLRDIATFFDAMTGLLDGVRSRTQHARGLLRDGAAHVVLVTGPRVSILDDTRALTEALAGQQVSLAAVVVNRTHSPVPRNGIGLGDDPAGRWLRARWNEAIAEVDVEAAILAPFLAALPPALPRVLVPERDRDVCSIPDLVEIAQVLRASAPKTAHGPCTSAGS